MQQKTAKIKGLEINYGIGGQGAPFLILHGWGSNAQRWDETAALLIGAGFSVIVPDLPGFGKSQSPFSSWGLDEYRDFVGEFAEFLGLTNFYLVGHSFGGAVAAKFCLKFPEKISKLFLVASALIRRKTVRKGFFALISRPLKFFAFLPFYSLLRKGFYRFIIRKSDYSALRGVMRDTYLKVIAEDLTENLALINIPTIIIWGSDDNVTPRSDADLIKSKIKESHLLIIPAGTHDLERTMPGALAQRIIENTR